MNQLTMGQTMNSFDCPNQQDLVALFHGHLNPEVADQIFEHLESCEACVARLQQIHDSTETPRSGITAAADPAFQEAVLKMKALVDTAASPVVSAPVQSLEIGQEFGDFQIVGELGSGGMGVVYEAIQVSLQRRVALKVLPTHFALDDRMSDRFQVEAQAAARLHHTNIIPVFEVGLIGKTHFYAMQLIEGRGLNDVVKQCAKNGRQPAAEVADSDRHFLTDRNNLFASVARIGRDSAGALAYAHQRGVIHRDIKPSNLILDNSGTIWRQTLGWH